MTPPMRCIGWGGGSNKPQMSLFVASLPPPGIDRKRTNLHEKDDYPVMHGLLHASLGGDACTYLAATVVFAVGNNGPAVVAACLHQIDLIAALRAVFVFPQTSCGRQDEPLRVAVAIAPDLWQGPGFAVISRRGRIAGLWLARAYGFVGLPPPD